MFESFRVITTSEKKKKPSKKEAKNTPKKRGNKVASNLFLNDIPKSLNESPYVQSIIPNLPEDAIKFINVNIIKKYRAESGKVVFEFEDKSCMTILFTGNKKADVELEIKDYGKFKYNGKV